MDQEAMLYVGPRSGPKFSKNIFQKLSASPILNLNKWLPALSPYCGSGAKPSAQKFKQQFQNKGVTVLEPANPFERASFEDKQGEAPQQLSKFNNQIFKSFNQFYNF